MNSNLSLRPAEEIISSLRTLYDNYGYSKYKMNKFEEYDLYANNKDFLISDGVITFTDTNGKLMALKPDVTLSIIKNTSDMPGVVQKLYYNENVYRISKGTRSFKEIMQVGLEAIGDIDDYSIYEVLRLAAESLKVISDSTILEVSHLGLVSEVIDIAGIPSEEKSSVLKLIGEKNQHELSLLCSDLGISSEKSELLRTLTALHGRTEKVLPELEKLLKNVVNPETLTQFADILSALSGTGIDDNLRIDFSVTDNIHYYNGFVFKGFAEGIPGSLLSGGQYDALMKKMKRKSGAVGFAVYLDMLEQFIKATEEYDADVLLLYDSGCTIADIRKAALRFAENGQSVTTQQSVIPGYKYKKLVRLQDGEVQIIEDHA